MGRAGGNADLVVDNDVDRAAGPEATQIGEFERLGGTETLKTNIRLITATNKNLEEAIAKGEFREDLYYRLNVFTIFVPPLRDRPSDIELLVNHFLAKYAARERRADAGIAPEAMGVLKRWNWPGNVRELENVIQRALALSKDGVILPSDLPLEVTLTLPGGAAFSTRLNYQQMRRFGAGPAVATWAIAFSGILSTAGLALVSAASAGACSQPNRDHRPAAIAASVTT